MIQKIKNFFLNNDKLLHIGVSMILMIGFFKFFLLLGFCNWVIFVLSIFIIAIIGILKENYDEYSGGFFDYTDLIADGIGIILGILIIVILVFC